MFISHVFVLLCTGPRLIPSFSGFDDEALDTEFYDDLGYGSDIEGILDELCEDDL